MKYWYIAALAVLFFLLKKRVESFVPYASNYREDKLVYGSRPGPGADFNFDQVTAFNDDDSNLTHSEMMNYKNLDKILRDTFSALESGSITEDPYKVKSGFHRVPLEKDEAINIVTYVIKKINEKSKIAFKALDTQSFRKEQGKDGSVRYIINMFLVEDNKNKVNDYTKDVSFIVSETDDKKSIDYIRLIGDNVHGLKVVPGNSVKKQYRLMNELHLVEPYKTNETPVLSSMDGVRMWTQHYNNGIQAVEAKCFSRSDGKELRDIKTKEECAAVQGMYDSPVTKDEECPYYQSNTNYANYRGGVKRDGRCELPMGMKLVGYRYASVDSVNKPLCYNCKDGELGTCCNEQKDKRKYPNLSSPDYRFEDDEVNRKKAQLELASKGLHWDRYPGNRLEYKNTNRYQHQLEPVFNSFIGTSGYN